MTDRANMADRQSGNMVIHGDTIPEVGRWAG